MNSSDILCWRDAVGSLFISSPKLSIKITAKDGLLSIGDLTCGTRTTVLPCDIASFSVAEASKEHMGHLTLTLTESSAAKYGFFVKSLTWDISSPINEQVRIIKKYIKSLSLP